MPERHDLECLDRIQAVCSALHTAQPGSRTFRKLSVTAQDTAAQRVRRRATYFTGRSGGQAAIDGSSVSSPVQIRVELCEWNAAPE